MKYEIQSVEKVANVTFRHSEILAAQVSFLPEISRRQHYANWWKVMGP